MKEVAQVILGIIAGLLAIVAVPLIGLALITPSQPAPKPEVRAIEQSAPTAKDIISLVNDEREERGIAPLGVHPKLNESAKLKANDLRKYEYFEHANPETGKLGTYYVFDLTGYDLCTISVSENLAQGTTSSKETIEAWLGSPSHRDAMLSPKYELTGVAVVKDYRSGGGYIAVQHFCDVE